MRNFIRIGEDYGGNMDVTICVSTFGEEKWKTLAAERALPNARSFGVPVIYNHDKTLHEARNLGLSQVKTEFVCFLDADDELAPGFFEHMAEVDSDLRPPSVNHVYERVTFMPRVVGHNHVCVAACLEFGNWLVVGTVARTELLKDVGGWKEWGTFEDFDLWQRAWIAGATIIPVPAAIYRAYSTPQGRCRNLPIEESTRIQRQICETNLPGRDFSWLR
jgi:glycosyltransferase involved in cell wall biosynthesis